MQGKRWPTCNWQLSLSLPRMHLLLWLWYSASRLCWFWVWKMLLLDQTLHAQRFGFGLFSWKFNLLIVMSVRWKPLWSNCLRDRVPWHLLLFRRLLRRKLSLARILFARHLPVFLEAFLLAHRSKWKWLDLRLRSRLVVQTHDCSGSHLPTRTRQWMCSPRPYLLHLLNGNNTYFANQLNLKSLL